MQSQAFRNSLAFLTVAFALFAIAAWLRLAGTGWDEFASLHPDERHLLFVIGEISSGYSDASAKSLALSHLWFASGQSPLDPHATSGGLVYGEFPILSMALLAIHLEISDWTQLLITTRTVTALIDSFTILAVVMLGFEVTKSHRAALLAGLLYASAPTSLQLANFYTVDTWLTAGFACSALLLFRLSACQSFWNMIMLGTASAVAIGLTIACKITGLVLGLPVLFVLLKLLPAKGVWRMIVLGIVILAGILVSYRLLNPFAFAGPGIFDVSLSADFIQELSHAHAISKSAGFPPNWQWLQGYSTPDFLRDFVLFGCGPVIALLLLSGLRFRKGTWQVWTLLSLCAPILIYSILNQASVLRYAAPALPVLAVLASLAVLSTGLPKSISLVAAAFGVWWGSGVYLIHTSPHPRLEASRWIWSLPKGTVIANESGWDDGLPVPVTLKGDQSRRWSNYDNHFEILNLELTNSDSPQKAADLAEKLKKTDYLIISSGRQALVLPRFDQRFAMTKRYYEMLYDGELCFELAWQDIRGYRPLFLEVPDLWAQEPWRVYDHPMVQIFRKNNCFDQQNILENLKNSL